MVPNFESFPIVLTAFRKACAAHGIPASTLTDIQSSAGRVVRKPDPRSAHGAEDRGADWSADCSGWLAGLGEG
jgi:hypothetical protein